MSDLSRNLKSLQSSLRDSRASLQNARDCAQEDGLKTLYGNLDVLRRELDSVAIAIKAHIDAYTDHGREDESNGKE